MPFDQSPTSLADIIIKLEALPNLPDTRRRDLISAINRISKFLNRVPADLPTDAPALRGILATIHPAQAGISAKSLTNVKANLSKALSVTRAFPRGLPEVARTASWATFFEHAGAKHQEWSLARFAAYCCSRRLEPEEVCDTIMSAFQAYLDQRHLGKDPAEICKAMTQTWNGIVERNNLSLAKLTPAPNPQYRCRPLTDYPLTLQVEIAKYLKRRTITDPFSKHRSLKPLRPTSVRNTEAHIRQFLDALVYSGFDPAEFSSLADVVTPKMMKAGLAAHMHRRGATDVSGSTQNIAATLTVIARHHLKLGKKKLEKVVDIKVKASVPLTGMCPKNARRLMQFDDEMNIARIVSLPRILMQRAIADPARRSSALLAMHAAAMAILLSCPMRVKNLSSLDLDLHLIPHRNRTHTTYGFRIEGVDVKNREPIEFSLNNGNSGLLHRYITTFRGALSEVRGTALFPKESDGLPRTPDNFSSDLMACIYRETGIEMNAHLFRHFGAKIFLDAHPGQYETVRRLLKHKNLKTTLKFYAELNSQHAHDAFSAILVKFGGFGD
jgi:site-specific recombinase XerD